MRLRTLTILWPSFLMAAVLEGIVFSFVDPRDIRLACPTCELSPLAVYTLGFLVFWLVISCASAITAQLAIALDDDSLA